MEILSDPTPDMLALPQFDDGAIDMQELLRRLAEQIVNAVMDAEADQLCGGGANSRNGYRERAIAACVGTLTLRIPKLRSDSFFPEDVIERCQRADRALLAAVTEMYATGTSTRKVQRVAEKMGVSRLSKDQVSAIPSSLDADIEELCGRPLGSSLVPYVWLDASYVKCRREGRVVSTAVVTAVGCGAGGWRRVLGVDAVDTESYDSWLAFLGRTLDGDVVAHGPDEGGPCGERLSAALEDGTREGVEPSAAAAAAPPRDASGGGAVPPGVAAYWRALRVRPIGRGGLGERARADLLAAASLVYGFPER